MTIQIQTVHTAVEQNVLNQMHQKILKALEKFTNIIGVSMTLTEDNVVHKTTDKIVQIVVSRKKCKDIVVSKTTKDFQASFGEVMDAIKGIFGKK